MAVAPLDMAPAEAFDRVSAWSAALTQAYPNATKISTGMSADWQEAIVAGATHVRIGTSITGKRPQAG
jgi:uncharacterized pyridoxal phosphate-containing UPF0001 family protein